MEDEDDDAGSIACCGDVGDDEDDVDGEETEKSDGVDDVVNRTLGCADRGATFLDWLDGLLLLRRDKRESLGVLLDEAVPGLLSFARGEFTVEEQVDASGELTGERVICSGDGRGGWTTSRRDGVRTLAGDVGESSESGSTERDSCDPSSPDTARNDVCVEVDGEDESVRSALTAMGGETGDPSLPSSERLRRRACLGSASVCAGGCGVPSREDALSPGVECPSTPLST